jgi:bifunctional non-homologous end joining protein LigD
VHATSDGKHGNAVHTHLVAVPRYQPQLAVLAKAPPKTDDFVHEWKADGFRMAIAVEAGRAKLISRHGKIWSDAFPTVCQAALRLPLKAALLDGELVVLMPDGLTNFQALQNRSSLPPGANVAFMAFDLLFHDGEDVGRRPLEERKALLEQLLATEAHGGVLRYVPHFIGDGSRVLAAACELGAEGIVSKHRQAPHIAGRSRAWLKSKCARTDPFVIGGFTVSGTSIGALLVGYYDAAGALRFAGGVGTGRGFTREFLQALRVQLTAFETQLSPFADFDADAMRSPWGQRRASPTRWVQPLVVADVSFLEITTGGQLRHPSFQRLRLDLQATTVVRP